MSTDSQANEQPQASTNKRFGETGIYRIILMVTLTMGAGAILFAPLGPPLAERLIAAPVFAILIVGWYVGRGVIAAVGHYRHRRRKRRYQESDDSDFEFGGYTPSVSVLIPAYNEEDAIAEAVASVDRQTYEGEIEIIVTDDGSTDDTWEILKELMEWYPSLRAFTKENGGCCRANNHSLQYATGEVIVRIDADGAIEPTAIEEAIKPFANPDVDAVASNVQIRNDKESIWTRMQALEYTLSMEMARMFQFQLHHLLCMSGAFQTIRRDALEAVDGWSTDDTVAEDFDVSIKLQEHGRIWFQPDAIAYTDAPTTFTDLYEQRVRWAKRGLATIIRHRNAQFNPSFSMMGLLGLPLKALLTAGLLVQVGRWVYTILTSGLIDGVLLATKLGSGLFFITLAFAALLLAITLSFAVTDKPFQQAAWIPIYLGLYRLVHIVMKLVGYTGALYDVARDAVDRSSAPERNRDKEPIAEIADD